jgi:DNA adenine methylase
MLNSYDGKTFVDAFCGSCAVIQDVPTNYLRIANDKNRYLIAMWRSLTVGKDSFPTIINKELYGKVRDCFHGRNSDYEDDLIGWVGYMASFNGRFFSGGYSGHNVTNKTGKTRDYITENINNITKQLQEHNLKNITWFTGDYWNIPLPDNSLIYCDIPYRNTKQYDTSKNFNYGKFYNWCRTMKKDGHTIFVSEYNMPDDFKCIWEKEVTNAMNPTITKKPIERLFTL